MYKHPKLIQNVAKQMIKNQIKFNCSLLTYYLIVVTSLFATSSVYIALIHLQRKSKLTGTIIHGSRNMTLG